MGLTAAPIICWGFQLLARCKGCHRHLDEYDIAPLGHRIGRQAVNFLECAPQQKTPWVFGRQRHPLEVHQVTVRLRVLLIVSAAAVAAIATLHAASQYLTLDRFLGLEDLQAKETTMAIRADFQEEIKKLDRANTDLSVYDGTYDSMPAPTKKYLHSILGEGPNGWLEQQNVNFLVLVDAAGKTVSGSGFDAAKGGAMDVPEDLKAHISGTDRLLEFHGPRDRIDGLLLLSSGAVLVASRPIVHTNYGGPAHGALVTARYLDSPGWRRQADKYGVSGVKAFRIDRELPTDVALERSSV